jgi:hypothetical protein
MKAIKFLMAMTLATVPVMSGFMESAAAQFKPGTKHGQQSDSISTQFDLFDTDRRGNFIHDAEQYNDSVGVFFGAIENYEIGFADLLAKENGELIRDSSGFAQLAQPFRVDKRLFEVGGLQAELVSTSDGLDAIRYSILKPAKDGSSIVQSNLQQIGQLILNPETLGTNQYISERTSTIDGYPQKNERGYKPKFDTKRAVNDLTYILENNLLEGAIATYQSPEIPRNIIGLPLVRIGVAVRPPTVPGGSGVTVPEPSATLGALAVLSAGLLLKRKMKQN